MSLYEPKTAESNEAFQTNLDHSDPSHGAKKRQAAEVILRLPDLDQMDAEFEEEQDAAELVKQEDVDWDDPLKSKRQTTDKASRFDFLDFLSPFSLWKSHSEKERIRRIISIAAMLLFAGILGFGAARITDGLELYSGGPTNDCPAPNAPAAPLYQQPQYASDKSPAKDTPLSRLPIDLATPQLGIANSESPYGKAPLVSAENQMNQARNSIVRIAPPVFPGPVTNASQSASASRTPIPVGPNLQQNQVFARSTTSQGNPNAQVNQADRFSPERIQNVLNNQQGAVQTIRYPQIQQNPSNHSSVNYPPTSVPTVARRQVHQPYPNRTTYPPQGSASTVPPISPYPPTNGVYQTPAGHTTRNWPAERTYIPPSTPQPYRQPVYPPNGYGYPVQNMTAQPPVTPSVYR